MSSEPLKKGWLFKKAGNTRPPIHWNSRYFVVEGNNLIYYADEVSTIVVIFHFKFRAFP